MQPLHDGRMLFAVDQLHNFIFFIHDGDARFVIFRFLFAHHRVRNDNDRISGLYMSRRCSVQADDSGPRGPLMT